jgi:predicted dithiol-disulfide oxidoreductase (DUF899 family)
MKRETQERRRRDRNASANRKNWRKARNEDRKENFLRERKCKHTARSHDEVTEKRRKLPFAVNIFVTITSKLIAVWGLDVKRL